MKGIYNVWGVKEFFLLAKFRSVTQQNKSLFQFQGIAESSNVKDINVCAKNPCCADLKFLKEVAVRMTTVVFIFIFCLARSFCDLHIFCDCETSHFCRMALNISSVSLAMGLPLGL